MTVEAGRADGAGGRPRTAAARLAVAMLVLLLSSGPTGRGARAAAMEIEIDQGRMTAELGAVPVTEVLAEVGRLTGAEVKSRGELGNTRPQAFSRVPLAEALPRVLAPNGVILQFQPDRDGDRRLVSIRVVAPGSPGTPSGRAAAVTLGRQDPRSGLPPGFWDYTNDDQPLPDVAERSSTLQRVAHGPAGVRALMYVVRNDPDTPVRQTALALLAPMKTDEARSIVTETLADADPQMRMDALRALVGRGPPKPVTLLAQAAKGDADIDVRVTAIGMLSGQDGDLARAVLEGARQDADPKIREAATAALRH